MLKKLKICFTKEFNFYFQSKMAYLLFFIYTAMTTSIMFYTSDFYSNTTTNFYQFFKLQPGVMAMIIPAITMRLWADEYRNNTLEILLTQPVSYLVIVLGKFLAAWSIVGIMFVFSMGVWGATSFVVEMDSSWILINYALAMLMSGVLCAVSMLVASLCYNTLGAFLVALIVCIILISVSFGGWISSFIPENVFLMRLFTAFDLGRLYEDMILGQPNIAALLYFVLLICFAIWLSIIAVEYKRS